MKIYKDILSGDELASDSFPMTVVDNVVYEVTSKLVTKTESANFDIGANPSAEGGEDESYDAASQVTVNALVDAHRLQETSFDKKGYMAYIKGYMKALVDKLKETNPDRVAPFQKEVQAFVKDKILAKFDDFQFFQGESMNPDGMVLLMFFKEDGMTPYFWVFKDGVEEEKV